MNEECVKGSSTLISSEQSADYIHVDDCICLSDAERGPARANQLMSVIAAGLEASGFSVSTQLKDDELKKAVGYEVIRRPACLQLPLKKQMLLREALLEQAEPATVDAAVLRSLLGIWIFGALVNQLLLSVPFAVFRRIDAHPDTRIRWWPSARDEVRAMARLTQFMKVHLGDKLPNLVFATDANFV